MSGPIEVAATAAVSIAAVIIAALIVVPYPRAKPPVPIERPPVETPLPPPAPPAKPEAPAPTTQQTLVECEKHPESMCVTIDAPLPETVQRRTEQQRLDAVEAEVQKVKQDVVEIKELIRKRAQAKGKDGARP